ncbi:MAG: tRNA guanosine(34) transglycosylase Tgt, partial [Bdellovibrionota bacterium]
MFKLINKDGKARRGQATTASGTFETPNFMSVGTQGSVKGIDCEELSELGAQIILVNTYHLWVRPGEKLVESLGGIHKFTGWNGPILSDSGGFQVFSLKGIRKITEEGVKFKSHLDGADLFLSPEKSIQIQETLGVDIAMVLDECPAGDTDKATLEKSLAMTNRWAKRCLEARTRSDMAIFGITQGGTQVDLRTRAAEEIGALPFEGYAIGGLSVGEPQSEMYQTLEYHPSQLPDNSIRYLMGVGTPEDIVVAVRNGVDL